MRIYAAPADIAWLPCDHSFCHRAIPALLNFDSRVFQTDSSFSAAAGVHPPTSCSGPDGAPGLLRGRRYSLCTPLVFCPCPLHYRPSSYQDPAMKRFAELSEQEVLALAITNEEEDCRIYLGFADRLRERYPPSAKLFAETADASLNQPRTLLHRYRTRL